MAPTLVVHITTDGDYEYLIFGAGECRFLVVDEGSPNDRVYALTLRSPRRKLAELIGDSPIGSIDDVRHDAVAARILADVSGEPHLRCVEVD